jgi:hypothetical protein
MAINQQPLSQTIIPTGQNVTAGSSLTTLGNTASALSQIITERVNDVAISKAATQGENDVLEGNQPDKLALPFTRATKAYNNAVADTEARRQVLSAEQLINESLTNNKNPATFNSQTPANFKGELEGIRAGILQNTRPETRAKVTEALDRMEAHASLNMLQHSIEFDNRRVKEDMKHDIKGLLEARRNAAIEGDAARLAGIDAALDSSLNDYSTMNQEIKQIAPYLRTDIEKHKIIDNQLSGFSKAIDDGTTSKYLSDLADNKQKLPFNVWQDSVKAVVALDQEHKRLKNDVNAEQVVQVDLGIANGSIQSARDILNYPELTVAQQLTAMKKLSVLQANNLKQGSELITAQQNILSNRPTWNTADTKNKMFQSQIQNMEKQTGRPATLLEMEQSVLGEGQFPASGMQQTAMGSNVPAFDSVVQQKLTSGDPMQTAEAAMVYNDMVNTKGEPNSVNVTGDALAVASLFNELNKGGVTPDQAAEQAINSVLKASEPQIAQRIDKFQKTLEKVNPSNGANPLQAKFKQAFGSDPQAFGSDEAFKLFSDTYRANYISSNSEEAAFNATKYEMRAWGTSKYFDKGYVGQPVPEKEVPIAQVANAFPNQIASNLQGYINRTTAAREAHPELNIPLVEWANPEQTIKGNESEQDKVFKNMTIGDRPRIKINGHETDVVLIPSATSRLDNNVNYVLGYYDKFNNLTPLKDVTNTADQVARFAPKELSLWAPSIATKQTDDELKSYAKQVLSKETKAADNEIKEIEAKAPEWQVILGLAKPDEYLKYIEKRNENSNEGRLNQIVESLRENKSAAATRDEITDADNVGIAPDDEQVIAKLKGDE